jgi:beta-galactosidase
MKHFKHLFLSVAIITCAYELSAQNPDWENPEVFAINKEDTRTTSLPYPNENLAATDEFSKSPYYRSLDGLWKFRWMPKIAEVPEGFYAENYDDAKWIDMPVPGNWEFNGYGVPMYVNSGFSFEAKPPYIDREDSPTGCYRQEFNIPEDWDGRRVFIHFEGGTNSMYLWVNGQKAGYTESAKNPAEFDITDYIRKGKNLLACEVHKYSDGSYFEDQDMWRLGGINRSVYLYSTGQTRIMDFFAHPDLDKNYKNGIFSLDVKLKNYSGKSELQTVDVTITDRNGKKVFNKSKETNIPAGGGTSDLTVTGSVSSPMKWNAETPNLYTLIISLKNGKNIVESTSHKIGFRKIEIKDGQLLINGKKVYFKGVDLHEFNAYTGQVVTRKEMMRNLQLMKELNINAVRTSHYPQQALWYKLCDEYGIYIVNEANVESHGLTYGPNKTDVANFPEWRAAHIDRAMRLVERDKNHASVITWSLGNESGNGKAFYDMYDWIKARDKSRPVQQEAAGRGTNTDILCPMYPSFQSMLNDAKKDLGRPYILCEYAHAMGNSMGNFQEYWDVMRSSKNMQGGFIWEWYNHAYPATDEQGRLYWAYGGDLKSYDRKNDGNFIADGLISPDQNYLPHTYIVKKVYQNILFEAKDVDNGIISLINDFKFTELTNENYTYKWVLLKNGENAGEGTFDAVVPADGRKDVKLNIPPRTLGEGTEYYLQIFAYGKEDLPLVPAGFEVAKAEFAFPANNYFVQKTGNGNIDVNQTDNEIAIKSDGVDYKFAIKDNRRSLTHIGYENRRIFNELPKLNFWRAPTDNDFGEGAQYRLRLWESAGYNAGYQYKGIEKSPGKVAVKYSAKLLGIEAAVDLTYTVTGDGNLTVEAHYKALSGDLPEMMRFGMIMTFPESTDEFTWYGRGPRENYIDRNLDAFMGIWNGKVTEQVHPYIRPQETGNKTDVRWLTLTDKNGKGIKIAGTQPLSASALNNRPEDFDPGTTKKQQHASDIIPRHETVLCVDLFQRGVAGLNTWGATPLDKYRFREKEYRYSYTISVIK